MYKDKLNQIKAFLSIAVKLESKVLADGMPIEAEVFETGYPVFISNEDGTKSPLAAGTYLLDDGSSLEVDVQGNIVAVSDKAEVDEAIAEEEMAEEEAPAEEAKEDTEVEVEVEDPAEDKMKEVLTAIVGEMEAMKEEIANMKSDMANMKATYEKLSKTPAGKPAPKAMQEFTASATDNLLESRIAAVLEMRKDKTSF